MMMLKLTLSFFVFLFDVASPVSAVVLSKEVKQGDKVIKRCVIDTEKLSIKKTIGLLDEIGELSDFEEIDFLRLIRNAANEPKVLFPQKTKLLASSVVGGEVYITVLQDAAKSAMLRKILIRGKNKKSNTKFIRVGRYSSELLKIIEKHCR